MAYIIYKTNGQQLLSLLDGTVDSSRGINFVGKNYINYGTLQNENFLRLLENQANDTPPLYPLVGQLWYDTSASALKYFNGSDFKSIPNTDDTNSANAAIITANTSMKGYVDTRVATINSNVSALSSSLAAVAQTVATQASSITGLQGVTYADSNVAAYLPTYDGEVAVSTLTVSGSILPTANAVSNIGSSDHWFNNFYGKAIQAQYADLAEKYTSDANYPPGTVVVFGTDTEVTISSNYSDPRVAGVVSTDPAYLMNASTQGVAVALQGRVPCKVTGNIKRGDMMITSDIQGVATSCNAPAIGTVIGKALENYNSDKVGVIEILVGRV